MSAINFVYLNQPYSPSNPTTSAVTSKYSQLISFLLLRVTTPPTQNPLPALHTHASLLRKRDTGNVQTEIQRDSRYNVVDYVANALIIE